MLTKSVISKLYSISVKEREKIQKLLHNIELQNLPKKNRYMSLQDCKDLLKLYGLIINEELQLAQNFGQDLDTMVREDYIPAYIHTHLLEVDLNEKN